MYIIYIYMYIIYIYYKEWRFPKSLGVPPNHPSDPSGRLAVGAWRALLEASGAPAPKR